GRRDAEALLGPHLCQVKLIRRETSQQVRGDLLYCLVASEAITVNGLASQPTGYQVRLGLLSFGRLTAYTHEQTTTKKDRHLEHDDTVGTHREAGDAHAIALAVGDHHDEANTNHGGVEQ